MSTIPGDREKETVEEGKWEREGGVQTHISLICTNPLEILHIIINLSEEKKGVRGGGLEEKTGKKLLILTQIKLFETSPTPPPLFWIIPPLS